jgi:hypothetical protein
MTRAPKFTVDFHRLDNCGKARLVVTCGNSAPHIGKIDVLSERARKTFIARALKKFPKIARKALDSKLESIAAEITAQCDHDADSERANDANTAEAEVAHDTDGAAASEQSASHGVAEHEPSAPPITLLPHHRKLIVDSGISPEVAAERGYRSVEIKAELKRLGFSESQCIVPSLLVPVYGVSGEIATYQIRPDVPRIVKGKPLKYETPKNTRMVLDVPRRCKRDGWLGDPARPLFITEGARKADAGVSKNICTLALLGVWNWRGSNEQTGTTALADWESIAIKGREINIAFDSDVMTKPAVHKSLKRLKGFLESRGADVNVIYLPPGDGGKKTGLDDFFAANGSVADLKALARPDLEDLAEGDNSFALVRTEYRRTSAGIVRVKYEAPGFEQLILLTNFTAEITSNVILDDGVQKTQQFELHVNQGSNDRVVEIPAADFGSMDWVAEKLGPKFIVYAGQGSRDHARAAIQDASEKHTERVIYTHTGWRKLWAGWAYLHGGGAISADGNVEGVSVQLGDSLQHFRLPAPLAGDDLRAAVKVAIELFDLAADRITAPVIASGFRAVLGIADFGVHIAGPTGVLKTELAALVQQHFGKDFGARNVPGNWSSTGNALEFVAFIAKDAVLIVDDFVPQGGPNDIARIHREADRLLRAQGNNSGRQRMNADGSLRPTRSPRGLIVSTGEDTPAGQSLRARLMIVEISPGDISVPKLTVAQKHAREGVYAAVMASFVRWLAPQREGLESRVRERANELRATAAEHTRATHRRTSDVAAQLYVGLEKFAQFALESGALSQTESDAFKSRVWTGVLDASNRQAAHQEASEPATQFLALLKSAIAAGEAHLRDAKGSPPDAWQPEAVGWERASEAIGWQARGSCVGWVVDNKLFLDGPAAYRAAQKMADHAGRLVVNQNTLGRRLAERGLLVRTEEKRQKCTVREMIEGVRRDVLHVRLSSLLEPAQSAQQDQDADGDAAGGPVVWAGSSPTGPEIRPIEPPVSGAEPSRGPDGPVGPVPSTIHPPASRSSALPCRMCGGTRFWRVPSKSTERCGKCVPPLSTNTDVIWVERAAEGQPNV